MDFKLTIKIIWQRFYYVVLQKKNLYIFWFYAWFLYVAYAYVIELHIYFGDKLIKTYLGMFAKNEFYVVVNCSLGYFVCKYSILVIQILILAMILGGWRKFLIFFGRFCLGLPKLFKAIRILQDISLELTNWVDLLLKYGKKYNWFRSQKSKYFLAEQN